MALARRARAAVRVAGAVAALGAALGACSSNVDPTAVPATSVQLSEQALTVRVGSETPLVARVLDAGSQELVGRRIFWSVRDSAVARVSQSGVVRGIAVGSTEVSANVEGRSAVATVTVTSRPLVAVQVSPSSLVLDVGGTRTLSASGLDDVGGAISGSPTWRTSNPAVATVSGSGVVTAVGPGAATITATIEGRSADAAIAVAAPPAPPAPPAPTPPPTAPVASVLVSPSPVTLAVGATVRLAATPRDAAGNPLGGRAVTFASSAPQVAVVADDGTVTGVTPGTTTIRATSEGVTGTATVNVTLVPVASVTVSPGSATLDAGSSVTLTATARDAAGNELQGRAVTWSTGGPSVATVSSSGVVTGVAGGTAEIRATVEGASGTATVTVTAPPAPPAPTPPAPTPPAPTPPGAPTVASVVVSPASANVARRATLQLSVRLFDAGGREIGVGTGSGQVPVTWSSSDASLATVSASGLLTATSANRSGTVTVTATAGGRTGTAVIRVNP